MTPVASVPYKNMTAIEIFSSPANYKYKSKICSLSSLVVLLFIVLSVLSPLFVIHNAGGIWLRNRLHIETPDVTFAYKYLLLAERNFDMDPLICSTFTTYKENRIPDDCVLVKVQEVDTNSDGKKDLLKFEAHFYTGESVKSIKLLLFFNFKLQQLFKATIESIAVFEYFLHHQVQKLEFFGDLELLQKGVLYSEGLYETYNHSIDLTKHSLNELLLSNANRKFSARITNQHATWKPGYSKEEVVILRGELFYREHKIHYQPTVWEELKWAWVQYLSMFLVFGYIAKRIIVFLFSNRYLSTYIVQPVTSK